MGTHKRTKFITLGVIVALLLAGTAGFTVWYAYHSAHAADTALQDANKAAAGTVAAVAPITTYEQCAKSPRGTLTQTYPAKCTIKGGKTFTDNSQKYLTIKEWGVRLPYASADILSYKISSDAPTIATVISAQLAKQYDCTEMGSGQVGRFTGSQPTSGSSNGGKETTVSAAAMSDPSTWIHVGAYYYRFIHDQAQCSKTVTLAAQNTANDYVKSILPNLQAAQ